MKKIMFNDKFDLTDAVLEGRKTMTRLIVGNRMTEGDIKAYLKGYTELANKCAPYKIGEVVAVAQRGIDIYRVLQERVGQTSDAALGVRETVGDMPMWNNKRFVPAGFCLSHIRIINIKVEKLQDISDEDCMCEGVTWDYDDYPTMSRKVYFINDHESFHSQRLAFAALINRINGKSTWETNPYVFAYTFKLVE